MVRTSSTRATDMLACRVEVLTGEEEGRLAFVGATSEIDETHGPFLVLDIGGGSTELSVGTTTCEGSTSMPVGSVRITEQQLSSDPPAAEELQQRDRARRRLSRRRAPRHARGARRGDAARHRRHDHDRGCGRDRSRGLRPRRSSTTSCSTRPAAEDVFRTLATERLADRVHNPGLPQGSRRHHRRRMLRAPRRSCGVSISRTTGLRDRSPRRHRRRALAAPVVTVTSPPGRTSCRPSRPPDRAGGRCPSARAHGAVFTERLACGGQHLVAELSVVGHQREADALEDHVGGAVQQHGGIGLRTVLSHAAPRG